MVRIGTWLTRGLSVAGVLTIAALILCTGLGAVGRYLHLRGVTWSFELVGILFLWTIALGTVLAEVAGENVSIDGNTLTSDRGPWFRIYYCLVLLAVSAAFLWSGVALLRRTAFIPTPLLRLPSYTMHTMIVFIGLGLGVIAVIRLIVTIRNMRA